MAMSQYMSLLNVRMMAMIVWLPFIIYGTITSDKALAFQSRAPVLKNDFKTTSASTIDPALHSSLLVVVSQSWYSWILTVRTFHKTFPSTISSPSTWHINDYSKGKNDNIKMIFTNYEIFSKNSEKMTIQFCLKRLPFPTNFNLSRISF